jgi:hypothetical protein
LERASKKVAGKPDIFKIFSKGSNDSSPPKGRPQANRRGQRKKLKGYDPATQAIADQRRHLRITSCVERKK